jgi:hypothetical protein
MECTFPTEDCKSSRWRIVFALFFPCIVASIPYYAQVDTRFEMKRNLFLSTYRVSQVQWVCGMEVFSVDSTNQQLKVRFDLLKNWQGRDSLDLMATLDTTQTYWRKFDKDSVQTLKYTSGNTGVTIFIAVPEKYEHTLFNGMSAISWQFRYAQVILPPKCKKHQKYFRVYYEK